MHSLSPDHSRIPRDTHGPCEFCLEDHLYPDHNNQSLILLFPVPTLFAQSIHQVAGYLFMHHNAGMRVNTAHVRLVFRDISPCGGQVYDVHPCLLQPVPEFRAEMRLPYIATRNGIPAFSHCWAIFSRGCLRSRPAWMISYPVCIASRNGLFSSAAPARAMSICSIRAKRVVT